MGRSEPKGVKPTNRWRKLRSGISAKNFGPKSIKQVRRKKGLREYVHVAVWNPFE